MIIDFQVHPFTLKVKAPFQKKKGLLLYAKTEDGKEAWAEVSPLPGFSKETLEEAKAQLTSLSSLDLQENLLPSVAFGLDSLLYNLQSSSNRHESSYPVCGFLSGNFDEIEQKIPLLLKEGYSHVKLKVAELSLNEADQIIEKLLGKIKLKIDINRNWSLKKSLSFFSKYPLDAFEYIEEPVDNIQDLHLFPYPIALDETLRENTLIPSLPQIKAFIIKPMMTGSLTSLQKIVDLSKQMKAQIVLSHSYESGVGLFHLCSLFERANIPIYPLGVDTYRLINCDVLERPHFISKGMLTLSPLKVLDVSNMDI